MAAQDFMEDPIYGFIYELYIKKSRRTVHFSHVHRHLRLNIRI
jgi:hypothetical protein